jgi:hypothetical protein
LACHQELDVQCFSRIVQIHLNKLIQILALTRVRDHIRD